MSKSKFLTSALAVVCLACVSAKPALADEIKIEVDFATADTNADGKLSKDELSTHLVVNIVKQLEHQVGKEQAEQTAKSIVPPVVEGMFKKSDINQDGFLTEEELKTLGS